MPTTPPPAIPSSTTIQAEVFDVLASDSASQSFDDVLLPVGNDGKSSVRASDSIPSTDLVISLSRLTC